ncbi:protein-tyrosine-phosphatase [Balamuthia mandrillaris]
MMYISRTDSPENTLARFVGMMPLSRLLRHLLPSSLSSAFVRHVLAYCLVAFLLSSSCLMLPVSAATEASSSSSSACATSHTFPASGLTFDFGPLLPLSWTHTYFVFHARDPRGNLHFWRPCGPLRCDAKLLELLAYDSPVAVSSSSSSPFELDDYDDSSPASSPVEDVEVAATSCVWVESEGRFLSSGTLASQTWLEGRTSEEAEGKEAAPEVVEVEGNFALRFSYASPSSLSLHHHHHHHHHHDASSASSPSLPSSSAHSSLSSFEEDSKSDRAEVKGEEGAELLLSSFHHNNHYSASLLIDFICTENKEEEQQQRTNRKEDEEQERRRREGATEGDWRLGRLEGLEPLSMVAHDYHLRFYSRYACPLHRVDASSSSHMSKSDSGVDPTGSASSSSSSSNSSSSASSARYGWVILPSLLFLTVGYRVAVLLYNKFHSNHNATSGDVLDLELGQERLLLAETGSCSPSWTAIAHYPQHLLSIPRIIK